MTSPAKRPAGRLENALIAQSPFGKGRGMVQTGLAMIRFLHTRIRVRDLDRSVAFYQNLGYTPGDFKDSPQGNRLAFLMLPGNDVFLELCHSPDYTASCPEDLMHTALGVPDIIAYCGQLESAGIEIWPAAWREKFAAGGRKMAFVTDPDGYEVEILEI
jgi:lactoylglutathione lyase